MVELVYVYRNFGQGLKERGKYSVLLQKLTCNIIALDIYHMGFVVRKPVFGALRTTKRRPACPYGQTDQRLCYSLIGKYHIYTCHQRNFNFLASLCS